MKKTPRTEGYWWSEREPQYPKPVEIKEPFPDKEKVVAAFKELEKELYLHRKGDCVHYKGFSTCRCCNIRNGSMEFSYKNWKWPEGLLHYVEVHNIRPSDDFVREVLKVI